MQFANAQDVAQQDEPMPVSVSHDSYRLAVVVDHGVIFSREIHSGAMVFGNPNDVEGMFRQHSRKGASASADLKSVCGVVPGDRYRSEEHTSELQSLRHLVCRL